MKEIRKRGIVAIGVDFACPSADVRADVTNHLGLPFFEKQFQLLTAFDMLEHVRPEDVNRALSEMKRVSRRFIFSIAYRASRILVRGENLHPTVQPQDWWIREIQRVGGRDILPRGGYLVGRWR